MNFSTHSEILDALQWHADMGVDLCVERDPQEVKGGIRDSGLGIRDKDSQAAAQKPPLPSSQSRVPGPGSPTPPPLSIAAAVAEAQALADAASSLAELEAAVRSFGGCALKKTATHTVFATGVASSGLMIIGEAPGAEEDRAGLPFCGEGGQLLDKMLAAIGRSRTANAYLTQMLFWRPPGNRPPTAEELAICLPFMEKHIALVKPTRLVLLGATATKGLLGDARGITRMRGQVLEYRNPLLTDAIPAHILYHPSYLLRQPLAKKQSWADLLALKAALSS